MSTLITGISDFIGFHLSRKLLAKGEHVIGVDSQTSHSLSAPQVELNNRRLSELQTSANANHLSLVNADLLQAESIQSVIASHQPTTVIHLVDHTNNSGSAQHIISSTINLLEACRANDIKHCIINSSQAVYFPHQHSNMSVHELTEHPHNLKAAIARSCELIAHSYSQQHQLPCTIVRLFDVYGKGAGSDNLITQLHQKILDGESIDIRSFVGHQFDFTYVDDICKTLLRLLEHPAKPNPDWKLDEEYLDSSYAPWRVYNSGTGLGTDIHSLIATLENVMAQKADISPLPTSSDGQASFKHIADNTELLRDTGYQPRTTLLDGLKQMMSD